MTRARRLFGSFVSDGAVQLCSEWRNHLLTIVAIAWGAGSVVFLLAVGSGFRDFLELSVDETGSRWTLVQGNYSTSGTDGRRPGRQLMLSVDDLDALRSALSSSRHVAAEIQEPVATVRTKRKTRTNVIAAGNPALGAIRNHRMARGRWLTEADEMRARHVAVLGARAATIFFGTDDPIGQPLFVNGRSFDVVGVLIPKGSQLIFEYDYDDNMVFLPLAAGRRALGKGRSVERVLVDAATISPPPSLRADVRDALRRRWHLEAGDEEAIDFQSVDDILGPARAVGQALVLLLGFMGTVTLAMASVSVGNLMVAIANARRVEIAVRRACGARRRDVIMQLAFETALVVLTGGLLGIAFAVGAIAAASSLVSPGQFPVPQLSPSVLGVSISVLMASALVTGIAPARLAARQSPADALRAT